MNQIGGEKILAAAKRELFRREPADWIVHELGEFAWSKQREIANSVRDNRRTAVHACHEIGKSWLAARIAAWWLCTHDVGDAFVVTSAPSASQVKAVLWRELRRAHAKGRLRGRVNQTEWYMDPKDGHEELVAFGRKPADMDPGAFQGIHARYVLVIFDEACDIPRSLWNSADSLIANEESRFLAIGNPDDPDTEFAENCKPGSGWNVIGVGYEDTPNFTGEDVPDELHPLLIGPTWVEEKRRKWGETNPMFVAKVLGRFPETTEGGLIPPSLVKRAQARWAERDADGEPNPDYLPAGEPSELGVDVGAGGDKSVVCHRQGPRAQIIRADQIPDTMITCGNIIADRRRVGAVIAKVDPIGVGKGVVDRAKELKEPIYGFNVGAAAKHPESYANMRAETFWGLRERFQDGDIAIDPADEDLAAELVALKFDRTSRGQIKIASKDDMEHSPDRADALNLAFAASAFVRPAGRPLDHISFGRRRA